MIVHIQTFFNSLLGVTLPEVVYIIFALTLAYLILRMFFAIFNINIRVLDYSFYVVIGYLALSSLGGLVWNLSFS